MVVRSGLNGVQAEGRAGFITGQGHKYVDQPIHRPGPCLDSARSLRNMLCTTHTRYIHFTETHTSPSTPGSLAAHPSHSPCNASLHLSRAGRPGLVRSTAPVSTAAQSGFAMPATIYLSRPRHDPPYPQYSRTLHPPFRMSRQMRPSLSIAAVGHYVSTRKITTPHHPSRQRGPHAPRASTPTHRYWDGISWSGTVLWGDSWDTPREGTAPDEIHPLRQRQRVHRAPI